MPEPTTYQPLAAAWERATKEPNAVTGITVVGTVGELVSWLQRFPPETEVYGNMEEPIVATSWAITYEEAPKEILGKVYVTLQDLP